MLNFNQKSRPPERSLPDLNTSHIKLQQARHIEVEQHREI